MTQIPSDDILENCTNYEYESLGNSRPYWNCTIWRFIRRKPNQTITDCEQNLRMKNFEARNGNFETSAVVKNQSVKQRELRSLGYCWLWKANRQCSNGDICSFRHDKNKRAKSTQPNLLQDLLRSRM